MGGLSIEDWGAGNLDVSEFGDLGVLLPFEASCQGASLAGLGVLTGVGASEKTNKHDVITSTIRLCAWHTRSDSQQDMWGPFLMAAPLHLKC